MNSRMTHIFPPKGSAALAAIDIPDSVVASCHWTIVGFPFDDIDTVSD